MGREKLEAATPQQRYASFVGPAKPCGGIDQSFEHRLQIERRAANGLEHVGGRRLLLQRLA